MSSTANVIASIGKSLQTVTDSIDKREAKSTGTDKPPHVSKGSMPTHVAVEHGVKPASKGSGAIYNSSPSYGGAK